MLEPKQLGLRRFWLTTGHEYYACRDIVPPYNDFKPLSPGTFDQSTCATNRYVYCPIDRPGSVTGLSAYWEFELAIGEHVYIRVRYTNGGVPQTTVIINMSPGERTGWIRWNPGVYPFQAGDLVLVEHVSWTSVSTFAENLECIVEVSLEG